MGFDWLKFLKALENDGFLAKGDAKFIDEKNLQPTPLIFGALIRMHESISNDSRVKDQAAKIHDLEISLMKTSYALMKSKKEIIELKQL